MPQLNWEDQAHGRPQLIVNYTFSGIQAVHGRLLILLPVMHHTEKN